MFSLSKNLKVKVEPWFTLLVKLIYPLNYSVIYFAITKPSPIPLEFIYSVFYKNPKSLKSLS